MTVRRGLSEEVKALADDPARKIAAFKLHREQTGLGLKDAQDAVEAYIAGRGWDIAEPPYGLSDLNKINADGPEVVD